MSIHKIGDFIGGLVQGGMHLNATGDPMADNAGMSVHFMEFEPGREVIPHVHDRIETYIFLTGRAMVMSGDEITEVSTGDVAVNPAGTPHAIKVIGSAPLRFYALNSPPSTAAPSRDAAEEVLWRWKRFTG